MKRWCLCVLLALGSAVSVAAETQYVQVEKARLLAKPSAFAPCKAILPYRTQVEVLGHAGAYAQVRSAKGTGYLPDRSLSTQKPVYTAKLSKQYVSSEEVAMATKGFNAQVESEYRKSNPNLAYDELNRLEQATAYPDPAAAFQAFRRTGRLGEFGPGGGAQ